jgi:hypothetical protein
MVKIQCQDSDALKLIVGYIVLQAIDITEALKKYKIVNSSR